MHVLQNRALGSIKGHDPPPSKATDSTTFNPIQVVESQLKHDNHSLARDFSSLPSTGFLKLV
jgi:hypothetical protein